MIVGRKQKQEQKGSTSQKGMSGNTVSHKKQLEPSKPQVCDKVGTPAWKVFRCAQRIYIQEHLRIRSRQGGPAMQTSKEKRSFFEAWQTLLKGGQDDEVRHLGIEPQNILRTIWGTFPLSAVCLSHTESEI